MTFADLQRQLTRELGFTTWYGRTKEPNELTGPELSALADATARYVVAHLSMFDASQELAARRHLNSGMVGVQYEDTSAGAAIGEFFTEVGNQASDLNSNVNPFSDRNRRFVLWAVAVGVGLYFILPRILRTRGQE